MDEIRVLVIDDEKPALTRIVDLLEKQPDIHLAGVGRHGREAVQLIRCQAPDLLFLDIQMPGMNGFDVLREVAPEQRPITIFVTGYDKYAIPAFEAHALDYLLKPFSDERFEAALERARHHIRTQTVGELGRRFARLLEDQKAEQAPAFGELDELGPGLGQEVRHIDPRQRVVRQQAKARARRGRRQGPSQLECRNGAAVAARVHHNFVVGLHGSVRWAAPSAGSRAGGRW